MSRRRPMPGPKWLDRWRLWHLRSGGRLDDTIEVEAMGLACDLYRQGSTCGSAGYVTARRWPDPLVTPPEGGPVPRIQNRDVGNRK